MPVIGYNEVYDPDGNLVSQEPVEVSDDELLLRQLAEECNAAHVDVLRALRNWDGMTLAQKDKLLKFLAGFYLVAGQRLGLFHVD